MTAYYLVRDVKSGALCSYKPGRTLLNLSPIFTMQGPAEELAAQYNHHCQIKGIRYSAVSCDDNDLFPCDYFEN